MVPGIWRGRSDHDRRGRALLVLAAAVALGPLVRLASPAGSVVVQRWLD